MDNLDTEKILAKNPQIDKEALANVCELVRKLREVRASGLKSTSPFASPPIDPYSSFGRMRTIGRP